MVTARKISLIVIHCAATPNGRWTSTVDIDHWHRDAGYKRAPALPEARKWNPTLTSIGYHRVIYTNGAPATGRHLSEAGVHARGFNDKSVGICLVGTDKFSCAQWVTLADQVANLCATYGIPRQFATAENGWRGICGHRDTGAKKTCPGFSVADWLAGDMAPLDGHILEVQQ
ncbi:hypothetical protein dqs_0602 [Azoarcus olearius]|uniref:N-acetylmuramoyl-L-alanine amidase n=1 Tax=Azoarcus sp. (strain BH72) TaxID=418699 RepID=UPI0008060F84|nr:N-acetylmuramoyl-L-alanine amidase [Azoarcus olearius]ANQ83678.1 hypothetical protein dqs_0602 [Azoarcus olearius]